MHVLLPWWHFQDWSHILLPRWHFQDWSHILLPWWHFLLATYFLLAFLSFWGDRTALHPQSLDGLEVQKEMMLSFAFLYRTDFL